MTSLTLKKIASNSKKEVGDLYTVQLSISQNSQGFKLVIKVQCLHFLLSSIKRPTASLPLPPRSLNTYLAPPPIQRCPSCSTDPSLSVLTGKSGSSGFHRLLPVKSLDKRTGGMAELLSVCPWTHTDQLRSTSSWLPPQRTAYWGHSQEGGGDIAIRVGLQKRK